MDAKLKKIIIYVSAGFIILLIIMFAISGCQGKKANYDSYQTKMEKAAKKYFESHEEELPTEDKKTSEYSLKKMIENGDIDDYTKAFSDKNMKCEGSVTVTNNNGYYLYTSELDCGDAYTSKTLAQQIKEDNSTESGQGLYEIDDDYVFRGDSINNYATFAGEDWRIISIDENNNINLLQAKTKKRCVYDSHYNLEAGTSGINQYYQGEGKYSNLMTCLNDYYTNQFSDEAKSYLSTQTVCYGARSKDDITTDGSTECTQYIDKQPISLISAYEYIRASIDDGCISLDSRSCRNFNWLAKIDNTYFMTPSTEKSNLVYSITSMGIETTQSTNFNAVLTKISVNGDIKYLSGNGSKDNPYKIADVAKKKK